MNADQSELCHERDGRVVVPPQVHHLPDLLDLGVEGVLAAFRDSQRRDFTRVLAELEQPGAPLARLFGELRAQVSDDNPFARLPMFRPGAMQALFEDLHEHVMSHPVWRHPFFTRVYEGRFSREQLVAFAQQYFNQVKNTRQCVALAIGRFHGLMGLPYGPVSERVSELTQIVLAQLVADEYGVGTAGLDDYPSLDALFRSHTHMVMYRRLFDGLGVPFAEQDVPMLPEVADNVLMQRMVAGDPAFTPLEALASVGLGMEWGVPEFFSLLLGGIIRFAHREKLPLTPGHLEVLIAHVKYDVLHAVSVVAATALHVRSDDDVAAVKQAVNALMAGRHAMMSGMYRHIFGEDCAAYAPEPRHRVTDGRYRTALRRAREQAAPQCIREGGGYAARAETPFD